MDEEDNRSVGQSIRRLLSINTRMLPAKFIYILSCGAVGSYVPYLNLFFISIGLSTSQAGLISGIRFLSAPIATALVGGLIDHTGHRKLIFVVLCLGASLPLFSMPWVAGAFTIACNVSSSQADTHTTDFSHSHTIVTSMYMFYAILGITIFAGFFSVPLAGFIDSVVMNVINTGEEETSFGRQRVVGSISFGLATFIAGAGSEYYSGYHPNLSHYTPIFFLFIVQMMLLIPVGIRLIRQADWKVNASAAVDESGDEQVTVCQYLCSLLRQLDSLIFLITVLLSGISYNLFTGFVFLFMRDEMQVSDTMMTLTIVSSTSAEILTFPFTSQLIKLIGDSTLAIIIGIFSYFVRFIVMSRFTNLWIIIPIQLLHGLGFSLSWAAQVEYVEQNTPGGAKVTMFTILAGLHFAVSAVLANVAGGEVYAVFGGRKLFLGIGVVCVVWTGVMIMHYHLHKYRKLTATYRIETSYQCTAAHVRRDTELSNLSPRLLRGAAYTVRCPKALAHKTDVNNWQVN